MPHEPTANGTVRPADTPAPETAPAAAALPPLLVNADIAGPLCGRSSTSWWRDHAAGRVPRPVKLGGATLWRRLELESWVATGCPSRREWEAMRGGRG
jgi:predicted DNA-binding transcriptional regulator AlpA